MATKLIRLKDGILVEAEVPPNRAEEIAGGEAQRVAGTLDRVQPLLEAVCRPLAAAWRNLSSELTLERAEVELGLSFEGEGNIFITKARAGANLGVKLVLSRGSGG